MVSDISAHIKVQELQKYQHLQNSGDLGGFFLKTQRHSFKLTKSVSVRPTSHVLHP